VLGWLFSLSLHAANPESAPSPSADHAPDAIQADDGPRPSLNLNFDTLLQGKGALQPLIGSTGEGRSPAEPGFQLTLGEETLFALKRQGLDQLGLHLLDDSSLTVSRDYAERQRRRWHLLERQEQLPQLHSEVRDAWMTAEGALRLELGLRLGDILLRSDLPHEARKVFETLRDEIADDSGIRQQVLERIVRAYFNEGRYTEALRAVEAVSLEFSPDQPSWLVLHASIALAADQPQAAATILKGASSIEARLWEVLARWQAKAIPSGAALIAIGQIKIPADNIGVTALRSAMIARIADTPKYADTRALALEALVQSAVSLPVFLQLDSLVRLIETYSELAEPVLSKEGISLDEPDGITAYLNQPVSQSDIRRRALAVTLLLQAPGPTLSGTTSLWLIRHLMEVDLDHLIPTFFIDSGLGIDIEQLQAEVIMLLVDDALRRDDLPLAARLQSLIDAPPTGVDHGAWTVRTARIFILGGEAARGVEQLGEWLSGIKQMAPDSLDRVMQIMFDLQFIGEHQLALTLFEIAAPLAQTEGHRRELFFWSAQSWYAVGDFGLAAAYYLESARLAGEQNPFWEKSALYQAAQALETGLFFDDAAKVYKALLGGSPDPKMQAKLRYRLAQLQRQRNQAVSP
jgi:tetratricopeptide (TPR) repeat protein